jgi:hypothetical protein
MENLGTRSLCNSCKKPIYHNGKIWVHVEGSPRHPALPLDLDRLKAEIAHLEHQLALKKHLLGLIEEN